MFQLKFLSVLIHFLYLSLCLLFLGTEVKAQKTSTLTKPLKEEQARLIRNIKHSANDSAITYPLSRYTDAELNNIYSSIITDASLTAMEKDKARQSLIFLLKEMNQQLVRKKNDVYDISGTLMSYKNILKALLYHRPFTHLLSSAGFRRSQLLAAAFSNYREYVVLDDMAVYKRVSSQPQFILQFLESKPQFRFADSLVLVAAAHDPSRFASYINHNRSGLQNSISTTQNPYLREYLTLSNHKQATELLPFLIQLTERRLHADSILKIRLEVTKYFQLLVNTIKETRASKDSSSIFLNLLRRGIKEKSLSFYVNQVNELHDAADVTRFASVKDLRPEDLYYIITSSGEELYTSSYLGLYKRLMEHFKTQSADSLFDLVAYDNFRTFMRLAANYNVLVDFLGNLSQDKATALIKRFVSGIENDTDSGLEKAMDIADSFTGLETSPEMAGLMQAELQANLNRCKTNHQYLGIRLYSILIQVFDLVRQQNNFNQLWATLGNYETLKRKVLEDKLGEVSQLVLFYGDEDGVASFNNFQKNFTDTSKWKIVKTENWISIHSQSQQPIVLYANRPLDSKQELDIKAQDALIEFLQQQGHDPTILIHRGHSYHLDKTIKRLKPSVKLAILGSCGSYNNAISIATINPDVQIIGSKKMGTKSINDPIIEMINQALYNKEDLSWPLIWEKLAERFSKDETTLALFNEYIPPSKNVSLFVLKLFNHYSKVV